MDKEKLHSKVKAVVRVITLILCLPFGLFVFVMIGFSADGPQGIAVILFRLAIILIPLALLVISLTNDKLYWLCLAVMAIIIITLFGWIYSGQNKNISESNSVVVSNKDDFDCFDPSPNLGYQKSYLSIKSNGDIIWVHAISDKPLLWDSLTVGTINTKGDVRFDDKFYDGESMASFVNCKNKDGELFGDVYKNITFINGNL